MNVEVPVARLQPNIAFFTGKIGSRQLSSRSSEIESGRPQDTLIIDAFFALNSVCTFPLGSNDGLARLPHNIEDTSSEG